jgi:hypothetical protein
LLLLSAWSLLGAGIGAHPAVGYLDPVHLAPAEVGAAVCSLGLALSFDR